VKKKELIEELQQARGQLLAAIDGLTEEQMMQPGAAGIWSVKDILAHLIAWEAELITALSRKLSSRYKDAPEVVAIEDIDEWNEEQYHLNARKPLAELLPDFHGVHKHLLKAIEDLDDRTLSAPEAFEWMEGEPLAYLVLEIAVWHERDHAEDIQAWREQRQQG
jgi:hypothetical protein